MTFTSAKPFEYIKSEIREVSAEEAKLALDERRAILLDVREQHERDSGYIPGAKHIPQDLLEARIEEIVPDRSASIIVQCAMGVRSVYAAHTLQESLGYKDVCSMAGGIKAWEALGYETVQPYALSKDESERYSRHILIPEVGALGQRKLLSSKVLLVGAGGLGAPVALYLAAAGVGTLGLVDDDTVDVSNLQRQVIHSTSGIGTSKVDSAAKRIAELNPGVTVQKHHLRLTADNILETFEGYDVIVDGADNFPTRYLINDASVRLRIPVVSAAILGFDGQLSVFRPYEGPCYRCLFPEPPPAQLAPSCEENGVLGVLPGTMGLLQATEVIKLILDIGEVASGRLLLYDALAATLSEVKVHRDPACPICSKPPEEISEEEIGVFPDYEAFCATRA